MNWQAVGALAELAASIGVLATLVYLALQIRKSHQIDLATLYQMRADAARELVRGPAMSESLLAALGRAEAGEELSVLDQRLLDNQLFQHFNHFESSHYLTQLGLLSDEHWKSDLATIVMTFRQNRRMRSY
jgi:hypothetical protein